MQKMDTITAISTALGKGAIGIIRLSGKKSIPIAEKIFESKKNVKLSKCKSHTAHVGYIKDLGDKRNDFIDEVMITVMHSPNTYTGEDVVEISCHNNRIILEKILDLIIYNGARISRPGEFTERAFLNGKMDLVQAEAVQELISAETKFSEQIALRQLRGSLSKVLNIWRERLVNINADIEVCLDHEDMLEPDKKKLLKEITNFKSEIEKNILLSEQTQKAYYGINIVLAGRPNVGKSSILNAVFKQEKSIVTDFPGTTRDAVSGEIEYKDIKMTLTDTAGLKHEHEFGKDKINDPHVIIEKKGIEKTISHIKESDYIFFIIDLSREIDDNDYKLLDEILKLNTQNIILVGNKSDIKLNSMKNLEKLKKIIKPIGYIEISAKREKNIEAMLDICIKDIFKNSMLHSSDMMIVNSRQKKLLNDTIAGLDKACDLIKEDEPLELVSIETKEALEKIGYVLGMDISEDILESIFSRFCVGK
jgi:tRNA modification GTPase